MNRPPNDNNNDNDNFPKQREPTEADKQRIDAIIQALRDQTITMPGSRSSSATTADAQSHAFWDTQPMFRSSTAAHEIKTEQELHAPLIPNKPKDELRQTPFVEDDECMFRFDYSHDFLKWALTPPGYLKAFHLGVRSSNKGALVAVEINFLCVHKKLRSKRLAPVLIKEITRRVNLTGVFQAVYTAGIVLPGPVSSCRYYHRTLNPKKLVEVGFTSVPPKMTMARFCKNYKLPGETSIVGLRPMEEKDVVSACQLLKRHLDQFQLVIEFSVADFQHWFMPRKDVITTYVVTKEEDGEVTDMISYYHLHSSIQKNEHHSHLRAAYSFYNVATTVDLEDLMRNALILAKQEDMDVFNALEQMKNKDFFDALKFGKGDGMLQYYLYNWCCPTMEAKDVGIVLL
eukprot:CAMPEP_0176493910 /NCGR_PEP_ID=MMETSP0200_2-20121128/9797_1 /TAXON_ID=947934 /ORGANISM="Chaetoceros sp., Strain GSL56" /LENGTH=400 /DNA_ID=CAMNT_0017891597 /DNA_START=74 /DNA_END=1277 /DNA_ORIENTATION=+